jgi:cytochrome c oxidase subunit 2
MNRNKLLVTIFIILSGLSSYLQGAEEREPYDDRYCTTCHGSDGRGNFGVQAPRLAGMEPWYLKRQLENFRGEIRGSHPEDIEGLAMQPMATNLTAESILDIIGWVDTWEYVPAEITIEGDTVAGKLIYSQCATCHGEEAEGNEALGAPALRGQNDWYLITQLNNFKQGIRGGEALDSFGQQMMIMTQILSDENAINNVVSYINTLGR